MLSLLALQILQRRPDPSPLTGTDSQQENPQLLMCERMPLGTFSFPIIVHPPLTDAY